MHTPRPLIASLFLIALIPGLSTAQDKPTGRLPDGRAYRTDSDGNQLVDYIAELEVTIEGLNRRINGLQTQLDRRPPGSLPSVPMRERNLLDAQPDQSGLNAPGPDTAVHTDPVQRAELPADCTAQTAALQTALNQRSEELEKAKAALPQVDIHEVETLREEVSARDKSIAELQQKLESARRETETLRTAQRSSDTESDRLAMRADDQTTARAALRESESRGNQESTADAAIDPARRRAIDSYKGSLNTELNKVNNLISTRDSLYREYTRQSRALQVQPSKPFSSRNLSTDQIRQQIDHTSSMSALSGLSRDIGEIRSKMSDDIALLKRVGKM